MFIPVFDTLNFKLNNHPQHFPFFPLKSQERLRGAMRKICGIVFIPVVIYLFKVNKIVLGTR